MTDLEPTASPAQTPPARRKPPVWRPRRPATRLGWVLAGLAVVGLLVAAILAGARYGVLAPQARLMIEARTSGLKLGRFGRLKLEGISGDIWTRFTVRRVTISDEAGVWIEANEVNVSWRYVQLLRRRLDVDSVTAKSIRVLRRPAFDNDGVSRGMPVTVQIDKADARIEMLPAFSSRRGVYDFSLRDLSVQRGGGTRLSLAALSVLHPGDHVKASLDLGRDKTLRLDADALEAQGGAIAGALGLAADQPFRLTAKVSGATSNGQLAVVSRSGLAMPISAQGAWTPDGGAINARVQLTASRHLTSWARWLGPEAQLSIVGKRASQGIYNVDIRGQADNIRLTATGPVDPAKQQAMGLQTRVVIGDVNRIFTAPGMGQAIVDGRFTGGVKAFKLEGGTGSVADIAWGEYRLASVGGPTTVTYAKDEMNVVAQFKARGGREPPGGWKLEVAGAAPYGSVHMVRLKDGRLLFRSLDVTGDGMRMKGTGTRSIFGRLDFKGDLLVTNLTKANSGFGGTARFQWIASQQTDKDPWNARYTGSGEKFTTGIEWMDPIIGQSPRITGTAITDASGLTIPNVVIKGGQADGQFKGKIDSAGQLRFNGDWSARGPFTIGPLEVTGAVKGTGVITGTPDRPRTDLLADFETLDLPQLQIRPGHLAMTFVSNQGVIVGGFAVNGDTDYGPARAKSQFRFVEDGMDLAQIDADMGGVRAKGDLSLRNDAPSTADLELDIGKGALLSSGRATGTVRIVEGADGPTADLSLQTSGAVVRGTSLVLEKGSFTGKGPLARMPYRISAKGAYDRNPLELTGGGEIGSENGRWATSFAGGGQARAVRFTTIEPIMLRTGNGETSARLRVNLGGGKAAIDAHKVGDALAITGSLQAVDIQFVAEDFAGRFDADIDIRGKGSRLSGSLNAKLDDARSRDAAVRLGMDGVVKAVLDGDDITIDAAITSNQGLKATGNFVLPAEAAADPVRIAIARNRPMRGQFEADGEVQPLWDLFLGGERSLGGRVTTRGTLAGTLADPQFTGQAQVQNGHFEDFATGLVLKDLNAAAEMRASQVELRTFTASDNSGGRLSGSGRTSLQRGGGGDLVLRLTKFRMIDNDTASADATGEVALTRDADGRVKIAGDLTIDQAQINAAAKLSANVPTMDVIEVNRPTAMMVQLEPVARRGPGAALDVRLRAPRRIFVRGRGLDLEMSVNARVTGTTTTPVLDGEARMVRGDYEFAGKRFQFDDRGVVRLSDKPELIRLDLSATREDPNLTAVVRVLGTAARPEITLTSTPVLPNDEVLSQVLFGRSASQLSPLEAAQLASALTSLATGGGFDVVGGLRSLAGLDRLSLVGGGTQGVGVAGGKYLTDNVYLELVGGGRDGAGAEVDFRVNRSLSIISKLTSQQGAKLAVRWRKDLGERKRGR